MLDKLGNADQGLPVRVFGLPPASNGPWPYYILDLTIGLLHRDIFMLHLGYYGVKWTRTVVIHLILLCTLIEQTLSLNNPIAYRMVHWGSHELDPAGDINFHQ